MILRLNSNALQTDRETLTARHSVQQTIIYDKVTFAVSRQAATIELQAGGDLKSYKIHPLHFTASSTEAQKQGMEEEGRN